MGIVPQYIDQVNTLLRWWENPCDAPWAVYAEMAGPAAGEALLALMAFGLDDVARGYFRPKNLRSGRHGRRGRRGGRRGGGLPEFGELIGKNLPGAEEAKGRKVSDGVKSLWLVDGVLQRGLFYWMVADVTLEFFADWLGAVQESEECRTQRVGAAAWEATPTVAALQGWQAFQVAPLYETGTVRVAGSSAFHSSGFTTVGGRLTVTFAADGDRSPGTGGDPHLEVRVRDQSHVLAHGTASPVPGQPGKTAGILSPTRYSPQGGVVCEIRCVPSGFYKCDQAMAVGVQLSEDLP